MKTPKPAVPFYFGSPGRELFGCFHEPSAQDLRRCTVLICQPMGHEYINSHRALRQLAVRLAEAGFPVLRFDYSGCGDSYGEAEQSSLSRWLEDISTAVAQLRALTGTLQVCVIGLRLGGTLAAISGSRAENFRSLVLWEPVTNGRNYLKELLALQKEILRFRPRPKLSKKSQAYMEILGFPLSRLLHAQLEELDLNMMAERAAERVLIVQNATAKDDGDNLKNHLIQTRAHVDHQTVQAPKIWLPTSDGSLLVPAQVLQSMVSWLCSVSS
ncbi:MAG TPA: alpha/beta hydrolase [Candidatus Angelobacter sp.]|nr:alpha/beta hydrolase [Candidatus Angelobacter sp.]